MLKILTKVNFSENMLNIYLVFIVILSSVDWRMAASEDCALAGKSNQHQPVGINARRDELGSNGDTYPRVAESVYSNEDPQILRQAATKPDLYAWRRWTALKVAPNEFFPGGSVAATVTLLPLTWYYVNPESKDVPPCDVWIRLCMKAYDTGYVCAHALHGTSYTFLSYCSMEFANCEQKLNLWQLAYFGSCNVERMPDVGEDFDIEGDNFLEAAVINAPPFDPLTGKYQNSFM